MRRRLTNYLVSVLTLAMVMTSLPVDLQTVKAVEEETISVTESVSDADGEENIALEEMVMPAYQTTTESELTGTFGDNNGFSWSYDENTATLTVTGEDSGLDSLQENVADTLMGSVRNLVFQDCVVSGSLACLLEGLGELESVEFNNFDTSNVTSMYAMFYECSNLRNMDVSGFDTGNVTNMAWMFYDCPRLGELDVSGFDTGNVTDMQGMFYNCRALETLDVSGFDTSNVQSMGWMFYFCSNLQTLDVSGFDTGNVTDMNAMFIACSSLEMVDVSGFDTGNVKDMSCMFTNCSFETLNLSSFDTGKVTYMDDMLYGCSNLVTIETPKIMAEEQSIDLPSVFYDSEDNEITQLTQEHCNKILTKNKPEEDENPGTFGDNNGFSWSYDESTATLTVTGEDSGLNGLQDNLSDTVKENMRNVVFQDCVVSGSLANLLEGLEEVEKVEFNNFDTSNVTDMSYMFYACYSLETLDVSVFDTSNVTDMSWMFCFCSSLNNVDVSGFDTSNVTDMSRMFGGCSSLCSLDVSSFDTSNVTDMNTMFHDCDSLKSLNLSGFNTGNVVMMYFMFYDCNSLDSVDVSSFDTSNVRNMGQMFNGCNSLISLNLSNFDTTNVANMELMFNGCRNLKSVDVSNFDTTNVIYMGSIFGGCDSLENVKTPDRMPNGQSIALPNTFCDADGNITTEITMEHCNKILMKQDSAYTITYHLDGGNNNADNPTMYNENSGTITLKDPIKTGYSFTGWNCVQSGNDTITEITQIAAGTTGNLDLYAQWTPNKYRIAFNGNGAVSGKMSNLNNREYDISYKLPTNVYKREGYKFTGWNTKADGKGKDYENLANVKNLTEVNGQTVTLYAQWTPNTYTIKFNKNGATSGNMNAMNNRRYGSSYKLSANKFKRKGYTFNGWNTQKNGKGKTYKNKASVKNLTSTNGKTITLYAQWKKESYKITYKLNGGKNKSSNPKKYDVTTKTITLKAPTRKGYVFEGWYKDSKFKKPIKKITKGSTGNITLYAKWEKK